MRYPPPVAGIVLLLCLVLPGGPAFGDMIDTRHLQSLGRVDYLTFSPTRPDRTFHVFVDLPEDVGSNGDRYPVVYLLDGGNSFPLLAAYHHYLRFGDEAPPVILVGISYGADSFQEGNMRQTDFTAPSPERDFWGGAGAFLHALKDGLIPLIERDYPADPGQRFLYGHSLGGQFVLFTALHDPGLFRGLIASNPAIIGNLAYFLDTDKAASPDNRRVRLFVAMSEHERAELKENTLALTERWQAVPAAWELEFRILAGQTHLSSVAESFRQGLMWLLPAANALDHDSTP